MSTFSMVRMAAGFTKVGFEDARFHSFRHYFVSRCVNRGVTELAVMEWVGHSDSAMVRYYYHLDPNESRRQMAKLD